MLPNHNDTPTITLQDLPIDALQKIFSSFIPEDFAGIRLVNKALSEILKHNQFWQYRFIRHFPYIYSKLDVNNISNWYQQFATTYEDQYPDKKSRKLFSLVKEMKTEELKKILQFSHLNIGEKNSKTLGTWISLTKNQSLLDHCYLIGNESLTESLKTRSFDIITTLLKLACGTNQILAIHTFVHNGARIHNYPMLQFAVDHGHLDSVNALLTYNVDVNFVGLQGMTPLHCAAQDGHAEIAAALLNKGANVNSECNVIYADLGKATPLCIATHYNHRAVVNILLENNADTNLGFLGVLTPLRIAKYHGFNEIALDITKHILRKYVKEINQRDDNSHTTYSFLNMEFNFSIFKPCAAKQDKDAANALFRVYFENSNESLEPHEKALNQGELKSIYEDIKSLTEAIKAKNSNGLACKK